MPKSRARLLSPDRARLIAAARDLATATHRADLARASGSIADAVAAGEALRRAHARVAQLTTKPSPAKRLTDAARSAGAGPRGSGAARAPLRQRRADLVADLLAAGRLTPTQAATADRLRDLIEAGQTSHVKGSALDEAGAVRGSDPLDRWTKGKRVWRTRKAKPGAPVAGGDGGDGMELVKLECPRSLPYRRIKDFRGGGDGLTAERMDAMERVKRGRLALDRLAAGDSYAAACVVALVSGSCASFSQMVQRVHGYRNTVVLSKVLHGLARGLDALDRDGGLVWRA